MNDDLKQNMADTLQAALERVVDERSFVDFLGVLGRDWKAEREIAARTTSFPHDGGALGWENDSIGTFLEAAVDWADASTDGLRFYQVPDNPWRRAADILFAGKFYE
ncbi:hypothetical protein WL40_15300 [Burkholderia ubonensis]|uniref:DUF7660 domain-containing protein n=1 Tax=Burkholderia ubonensis TaxID=101571 RepID=A0AAW3NTN7_9BURK|nr:hypothetical protein [Burkholderia ubonensis]AOK26917.1 hypothetical protein WK67_30490 [Burkholderia ubonensis]KVH67360.1 hypothetical protein WJ41_23800 [Burkholderia ubonensis]KVN86612.1 hypothetical protein WJ68_10820 [Burkholderia ubonensis]KVN94829.1 hypothetical protein WJ69_06335 [Burkholderia ubonensis]KVO05807.1 hypothetical protein WJ71_10655 [Burkholderia ubonensis]